MSESSSDARRPPTAIAEDLIREWMHMRGGTAELMDAITRALYAERTHNEPASILATYWVAHYDSRMGCSLCGNSGVLDTRGVRNARGREVGGLHPCICPNGQSLRRIGANLARHLAAFHPSSSAPLRHLMPDLGEETDS
jgi:hypothetical protein